MESHVKTERLVTFVFAKRVGDTQIKLDDIPSDVQETALEWDKGEQPAPPTYPGTS